MIQSKQIQHHKLILVVDDQEINRDILGAILEEEYELIYAEDGKSALSIMRERTDELSIVLLDLMMPIVSGYEVLEAARTDERLRHLPVIVLTSDRQAELKALQMGAADFITKPFGSPEIIQARVGRIIELSEGRQLISAAEHDPLTMLYSRNFFFEYAYRIYHYHPELHMDAIVVNIEQFHSVNALNGREFGDDVLRLLGNEIRAFLAESDGIASRFEADRFNIYCTHLEEYFTLLDRLQSKVNGLSPNVSIHLRMGVMPFTENVDPVLQFDQAWAACNMVRGNYQSPLMIYNETMQRRELLNQRLLNDLRSAVQERQFVVFYQPKYDIRCNPPRLSSAEALIRWKHPELGFISPGDFVPLFEGNGLIGTVDGFVWQEAAQQIALWREKYGITLPVSVNLSRSDVFDPTLVSRLVELVQENQLAYADLKLEVTESAYTDNARQVLDVIHRLR
ncbi:MAG: EAL domain-containing protein, partial [bacterium]